MSESQELLKIRLSVALVNRNRPDCLRRSLESVRLQSLQPFEVIISDDSSTGEHQKATAALAAEFGCRYTAGPQRGLYANRNHAALECRGTHVRTMDDDHTFPEGHFAVVERWISKYPHDVLTIGEYTPDQIPSVFQPPPIPPELHPRNRSIPPKILEDYYGISCGGTIYPKEIFSAGYRLNEAFMFGSAYLEFGSLLKSKGWIMRFISETYLVHHFEHADLRTDAVTGPAWICSTLCHSWFYQPSLTKKMQWALQTLVLAIKYPRSWSSRFWPGFQAALTRKRQVKSLPSFNEMKL